MPKATTPKSSQRRHNPLEDDVLATGVLKTKSSKRPTQRQRGQDDDDDADNFIDAKASKQILSLGRDLLEDDQNQHAQPSAFSRAPSSAFDIDPAKLGAQSDEEAAFEDEEEWGDEDEEVEEIEIDANDLATFNKFLSPDEQQDPLLKHGWPGQSEGTQQEEESVNLADLILAKIAEKEAGQQPGQVSRPEVGPVDDDFELPPKVIEAYTKIGVFLSRYKSGPLPKPFKVLCTVPHWEAIIQYTNPEGWSPNAVYAGTRIWMSAKTAVAQRFVQMLLLPRVRDDIYENKKLNVHLFNSLKKATFKPAAFFKGFLFELVGSGTCTLREANIVAGVLTRTSIPVLHSAAAIKGLCDIAAEQTSDRNESAAATNMLLKSLLEKGYALPWQVVDALVFYFLRVKNVISMREAETMGGASAGQSLPVIWHKNLLIFSQRYRNDITEDQREALLDLVNSHGHHGIGPEVRKELLAGRGRGMPAEQEGPDLDGDDTMLLD